MVAPGGVQRDSARIRRCTIAIEGVVQGVGFRPFVYRLAVHHSLTGSVWNSLQGVIADVEGDEEAVKNFLDDLEMASPPASRPHRRSVTWGEPRAQTSFSIEASARDGVAELCPIPDLATCDDCLRELADPASRRYGHPFVTCAACGPRFTIVRMLPYDRERTVMATFRICAECQAEYGDPHDRRLHAETISCPRCGPVLTLHGPDGDPLPSADPVGAAAHALGAGGIVAVKGVGGYHLACDATNGPAVAELRRRKRRDAKPLAVMVRDLAMGHALCRISEAEAQLLTSPARPIVLVSRRREAGVADEIAPGSPDLGILLPYTPLHHLLLKAVERPLVMTSGNASAEVIAYTDEDALNRLRDVADLFLVHDRAIQVPCDDSVARVVQHTPRLVRRSRGYVPLGIRLPVAAPRPIMACGGELKSTVALVKGQEAFLSQHLGDLTNERAFRAFVEAIDHLRTLFACSPTVAAHDLHPAYRSTLYAQSLEGVETMAVQHHHAHIASCLADNGVDRRVIGVAWDGSGYGLDGAVWGGEFLVGDLADVERAGHFELVPLPGGDAAVREPWRMAATFLSAAYGEGMSGLDLAFVRRLDRPAWRVLSRAIDCGLNAPLTSSAGRLFDAVASLLGLRDRVAFEAQAAMELEALAAPQADAVYSTAIAEEEEVIVVRTPDIIRGVVDDLLREVPAARIAARFHATLADVIVRVCERIRERLRVSAVALSGGVFQNVWLLEAAVDSLEARGFAVYSHRHVPANDGGLALGQAAVAARRLTLKAHA